jgi:hypothetical protein
MARMAMPRGARLPAMHTPDLAVALGFTDSKGLLGFGRGPLVEQTICFQWLENFGGFGAGGPKFAFFVLFSEL